MAGNIFKEARLRAAKNDERFRTAESAALELHNMSRERLYMIEQENVKKRQVDPSVYDVVEMANAYSAPELNDYYCSNICPIGLGRTPLMYKKLGEISAKLMSALYFLENISDDVHRILADSEISDIEKDEFRQIIKTLRDLSYSADLLDLWAEKNGFNDWYTQKFHQKYFYW